MSRADWQMSKREGQSRNGVVVAKHPAAAEAGRKILQEGGNAVDAAVATALALGVVEPNMSGLGGGGFLVYFEAKTGRVQIVNYAMRASEAAQPDMFELDPAGGYSIGLFAWRKVVGDANVKGPKSVAVPGTAAGLSLALERFGSGNISWARTLEPAIELAEKGYYLSWYNMLRFMEDWDLLARYPDTAAVFLPKGRPPMAEQTGRPAELFKQPALAETMKTMARDGAAAFYNGEIAKNMAAYITERGGALTERDLANYKAEIEEPLAVQYGNHTVYTTSGPSGGTTLAQALKLLAAAGGTSGNLDEAETWHKRIEALRLAFADRFVYLADPNFVQVPFDRLLSDGYAAERAALIGQTALSYPAPAGQIELSAAGYGPKAGESTTHLVVIDKDHNMVALTQTLLSLFGSGVLEPKSGVIFNNGMMWFDPEPGKANSVAPGKRPLSNMSPMVATKNGQPFLALGASGGRRILSAVAQVFLNLAEGGFDGPQAAINAPRFDSSQPDFTQIENENRVNPAVLEELAKRGHKLQTTEESVLSAGYASPIAATVAEDGSIKGGSERWHSGIALGA